MTDDDDLTFKTRNRSGISGELQLTREEVRAIKKLAEQEMREDGYKFRLGGKNWTDLDDLRLKCKKFLVRNQ